MEREPIQLLKAEGHDLIDTLVSVHNTNRDRVYGALARSLNVREEMVHFSKLYLRSDVEEAIRHLKRMRNQKYWHSVRGTVVHPAIPKAPKWATTASTGSKQREHRRNPNMLSQAEINRLVKRQKPVIKKFSFFKFIPSWLTRI